MLAENSIENIPFTADSRTPEHIAIIMDGNRRWAREHGLPALEGHRRGAKALRATTEAMRDFGIRYLTVYAFSTENNNRSGEEVSGLMHLIWMTLKRDLAEIHQNGVKLTFIGDRTTLPSNVVKMITHAEELTANNTRFYLTICLNYGAYQDLTLATKKIAQEVQAGQLSVENITSDTISAHLSTAHLPKPDILIRTSGEQRISNFLLWEISYAEIFFVPTYWPDFNKQTLEDILNQYQGRQRRYGR